MGNRKWNSTSEELEVLLSKGLSAKEIGDHLGVGRTCVLYWAHRYGLEVRKPGGRNLKDLTGKKFGRLTALLKTAGDRPRASWLCRCDCGEEKVILGVLLRNGLTKSCGCLSFEQKWKGSGGLSKVYWNRILKGAEKRSLQVNITIDDAWRKFEKQKGICALSGADLVLVTDFSRNHHLQNASLDRIQNQLGYTWDNTHWVDKRINMMKGTMGLDQFLQICKAVANHG